MQYADEFFGSADKIALMKRSAALHQLVRSNPRYAFYGRLVALSDPGDDTATILKALASIQGAGVAYYYPKAAVADLFAKLEKDGFKTDRHEHYYGGQRAYDAARRILTDHTLPGDLSIIRLGATTSARTVEQVAQLCQSCGVMPVPGAFLRGVANPGLTIAALDPSGDPVGSASSYFLHHPDSPRARDVFWGALSTRDDRRGQKIALILGAMAIVHMWEVEQARGFITGVRRDNPSSHNLCTKLGVVDSDWAYAQCLDTALLGGASITK